MRGPEKFECAIPRGAVVVAMELGIPDQHGDAIGIKWSNQTGWWVDVRDEDGIVRSYPAEQVKVTS
jgi:hypothetical protein